MEHVLGKPAFQLGDRWPGGTKEVCTPGETDVASLLFQSCTADDGGRKLVIGEFEQVPRRSLRQSGV
ncbi:hypothetical protein [Arthrobacter alpinus]|uniref:hypothetical protein n=1 Tax=Arthrobacter alpinus TaxID=656366 RepID=UPI001E356D28|nr:hypothetical protein [Arthrobacter alpinus]